MSSDRATCPFDSKEAIVGDLALHMGRKEDKLHEDWRKEHGLPAQIAFKNVSKMRFDIVKAIYQDKKLFNIQNG